MEIQTFRIATYTDGHKNQHKVKFHQWGYGAMEGRADEGNIMWSVGIIEFDDGHIEEVNPSNLKFEGKVTESI